MARGPAARWWKVGPVLVGLLEQDVEIAHRPQTARRLAEARAELLRPCRPERATEHPPGGALAAGRDAHPVEVLGVLAVSRAGLLREHPGQVEPHDLATRLGDVVVGGDAGGLADRELRGLRPIGRLDLVRSRRRLRHLLVHDERLDRIGRGVVGEDRDRDQVDRIRFRLRHVHDRLRTVGIELDVTTEGRERGLQLAAVGRPKCRIGPERGAKARQTLFVALRELSLEFDEPSEDPLALDDIHLVEAQLDPRRAVAELSLAAELADRDDLEQRRVTHVLQDERAGVGGRPAVGPTARSAGPSSSSRPTDPPGPSRLVSDLTETMVPRPVARSRTANPARSIADRPCPRIGPGAGSNGPVTPP